MNKRILALLLALVTVAAVFAGCGNSSGKTPAETGDETVAETATRTAVSINMWVVTDEKTTDEAKEQVEKALNEITKKRFTTYVDLIFFTKDEYAQALNDRFESIENAVKEAEEEKKRQKEIAQSLKAAGITTVAETTEPVDEAATTPEETIVNEYGVVELKYPEIPESQVDIILIQGYDQLSTLVSAGRLTKLDEEISSTGSSKSLTDYINSKFFDYTKIDKSVYAIPNNHVIGEYTYLLLNKKLADKYYLYPGSVTNFTDCITFVEDIKKNESIAPVKAPFNALTTYFWNSDLSGADFSVIASTCNLSAQQEPSSNPRFSLIHPFQLAQYKDHITLMRKYENEGYFAKTETEEFGVGVVKGDYALRRQYEDDYYVNVIRKPVADDQELYSSFFGVSSYTGNLKRSMEIVTLLNTTSEIRNILQYGVKDVHYTLNEDGTVKRLNDNYLMNLNDTGNVFMAYPEESMGPDAWKDGKIQNAEAVIFPLTGLSSVWKDVDPELKQKIDELSAEYQARLEACKTQEEVEEFFNTAKAELLANETYKAAVNSDNEKSFTAVYKAWYTNSDHAAWNADA